jgi:hypothetical protein
VRCEVQLDGGVGELRDEGRALMESKMALTSCLVKSAPGATQRGSGGARELGGGVPSAAGSEEPASSAVQIVAMSWARAVVKSQAARSTGPARLVPGRFRG